MMSTDKQGPQPFGAFFVWRAMAMQVLASHPDTIAATMAFFCAFSKPPCTRAKATFADAAWDYQNGVRE